MPRDVEPGVGPEWHHMLRKGALGRACGTWVLEPQVSTNLLVTAGKAVVASVLNGSGGEAAVTFLEVGTGSTMEVVAAARCLHRLGQ